MAAVDLVISQGQTVPTFTDTILDASDNPLDLTGATVTFVMRALSNKSATVNAAATIVNASTGQVSFTFSAVQTGVAALYQAQWVVVESGGGTYTFPNVGYRSVEVQPSLALAGQTIVSVADAKDILNFQTDDDAHDTKILRWIDAAQVVFEQRIGPIIPKTIDEWHTGGLYQIALRYPPSRAWGTTPIIIVNAVSEYNGPIEWPLALISTPDQGVLYSALVDVNTATIARMSAGGGVQAFSSSAGPRSVHIWYTTGQDSIPANVYEAVLEYLREMYQETAQMARGGWGNDVSDGPEPVKGYALSGRVLGILGLTRRAPACA